MKVVKLKAEHVRILKQTEAVSYLKDFSTDANTLSGYLIKLWMNAFFHIYLLLSQ
jgi:hypothetical protein